VAILRGCSWIELSRMARVTVTSISFYIGLNGGRHHVANCGCYADAHATERATGKKQRMVERLVIKLRLTLRSRIWQMQEPGLTGCSVS
jgi:hypothetical protein